GVEPVGHGSALALRHGGVVELPGPDRRRPGGEALRVGPEGRAVLDAAEAQAEVQVSADVDVGGGEAVAGDVLAARHRGLEGVHHPAEVAVTDHAPALL